MLRAERQPEQLMAEADAENRTFAEQTLDRGDRVADRGGITGTVGQEDAVRIVPEDLLGASVCRHRGHPATGVDQAAEDVALGAVVDGDDVKRPAVGAPRFASAQRDVPRAPRFA